MHQEDASVSLLYPIHWIGPFARRVGQTLTQILSLLFDFQRAKSRLKRPVAYGLTAVGIVMGATFLKAPAGLLWLPLLYYMKLIAAHAVSDE